MKVGTVFYNKLALPNTPVGSIGVCYEVYDGGISVIFETSFYDGFAMRHNEDEVKFMLKAIGFSEDVSSFKFKNVMVLSQQFAIGRFNKVFIEKIYEKFNKADLDPATFFYDNSFVDYD